MSKLRKTWQAQTAERLGVWETGLRVISEDPLDCKGCARHENGLKWGEETDRVFPKQNVYFSFCFILYFLLIPLCIELSYHLMMTSFGWRHSRGSQSPNCCSSLNVWEKRGEGETVGDRSVVTEEKGILLFVHI